jgi:hypothetical protein
LNQMVLRFVPPTYIKYLNENMDTKIIVSTPMLFFSV